MSTASFRNMLDNAGPKCYVEATSTRQSGTILEVIRNKYGIPVCYKVDAGDMYDYISVDRVRFWEPYDLYVPDYNYWDDPEEDYGDDEEEEEGCE